MLPANPAVLSQSAQVLQQRARGGSTACATAGCPHIVAAPPAEAFPSTSRAAQLRLAVVAATLTAIPAVVARRHRRRVNTRQASKIVRPVRSSSQETYGEVDTPAHNTVVRAHSPSLATGHSLWHDVSLHVKSWLDEDVGLYRYVNEMPQGTMDKFEVMTQTPHNEISEDLKGSKRLHEYGIPVPFNYGCFPQTFRDPDIVDDISGVGGDDDPLDVLDLCRQAVGVGEVVQCRPLGAVCLIDDGQADWKILAVNVSSSSDPLAQATSIEDVERIAPGRIQEVVGWIERLKCSRSNAEECSLHTEIYTSEQAVSLIQTDYESWQALVAQAGADGLSKGHWIHHGKAGAWEKLQRTLLLAIPHDWVQWAHARNQRHAPVQTLVPEELLER